MAFTDEDKQWLGEHFTQIDHRFTQIDQRFTQIDQRFTQIDQRFTQIDQRFTRMEAHIAQVEEQLKERIERVETNLLTEFHKWSSPVEMRIRTHNLSLRALEMELEEVRDRLAKLEKAS